jgi:hypothetical protein
MMTGREVVKGNRKVSDSSIVQNITVFGLLGSSCIVCSI